MTMPEASVHKDASAIFLEHNIRRTWQPFYIDTETETVSEREDVCQEECDCDCNEQQESTELPPQEEQEEQVEVSEDLQEMITEVNEIELTDVQAWNIKHGIMWVLYGIIILVTSLIGVSMIDSIWCTVPLIGGVTLPVPIMIWYHHKLITRYRIKKK